MTPDPLSAQKTAKDLYEILKQAAQPSSIDINPKLLRYVIYARKSTTGDERQERSIPDQIKDCIEKVVKPEELTVIGKPVEEKCSAKDPDIRPKFKQLLEDIRSDKIDGIITWHPDRLSRNMKEAGEIIDLLDKGILKDLRFATSSFENSPTGKMLLGISFVLSKQYSEHLSESVTRGNRRKTEDGIFFDEMKHGYTIQSGRLYPDAGNFTIIQQAFEMRLEGISQPDIAKWLNTTGYMVRKKNKGHVPYKWDKDSVSKLLHDPLYAGVLKYGQALAILEDFYDFTPVISVEDFFKINKVKDFSDAKVISSMMSKGRDTKANLLRGKVFCGYCHKPFSSGLTSKVLKDGRIHYYLYKCETAGCEFKNKSVRAKFMLDEASRFFDSHLFTTKSNYEHYVAEAKQLVADKNIELTTDIARLTRLVGDKQREYNNARELLANSPELKEHYDLGVIKGELSVFTEQLSSLVSQKKATKDAIPTYKEYLELFQDISGKIQNSHDIAVIDGILKKFFSNFTIKSFGRGKQQRCEVSYKLKEPWVGFLENNDFDCGRG